MAAELIEAALKRDKYQDQLEAAEIQVPVKSDSRKAIPQPQTRYYKEEVSAPTTAGAAIQWWEEHV